MVISEVIKNLEDIQAAKGDLECLIEAEIEHIAVDVPIYECRVDDYAGHGLSVKFTF